MQVLMFCLESLDVGQLFFTNPSHMYAQDTRLVRKCDKML